MEKTLMKQLLINLGSLAFTILWEIGIWWLIYGLTNVICKTFTITFSTYYVWGIFIILTVITAIYNLKKSKKN